MRSRTSATLLLIAIVCSEAGFAADQSLQPEHPSGVVVIQRVDHPPKLEEFLGMKPSLAAPAMSKVSNFIQLEPKDGAPAQEPTDAYLGYDAKNFYVVFVCFDRDPTKIRARLTRREDIDSNHDEVQLYLDTFNDKRRAFGFMINPRGIQFDYIWTDQNGYDPSWDAVWDSDGKLTEQGYVAIMTIPFKSLRFPASHVQTWGILLQRVVPRERDNTFYPHVTASIQGRLSQEGELRGLENISPGRNIQLNPYAVAGAFRHLDDRDLNNVFFTGNHLGADAGLDGKAIIKDSLVLDFTVNPDFRQLESDEPQITANQRFEVFFPEKRPFFQEGANYFDTPLNMYFTRRIFDPQFGVRLTGKLGPYGVGLLAVDDQSPGRIVPDYDPLRRKRAYFTVARLTRELWKQSQVGVFYSDREMSAVANTLCDDNAVSTTEQIACLANYNRVGGADFTFHFGSHFRVQGQALTSATSQADSLRYSGNLFYLFTEYSTRHIEYTSSFRDIGAGFVTLTGFFQRPDIRRATNTFNYLFRPEGKVVTSYGPVFLHDVIFDHSGNQLLSLYEPRFALHLKQSTDVLAYTGWWNELLRPVDYSTLLANQNFKKGPYQGFNINSAYLKWVAWNLSYFTGKNINFDPALNQAPFLANETQITAGVTLHPTNPLTITNTYILERLRAHANGAGVLNEHIIRSKINYQVNKRLSLRAIVQYDGELVNQTYTDLNHGKNLNGDFLLTYLIHPGTAFYIGYNSNVSNIDRALRPTPLGLLRSPDAFLNDSREFFVKISYLLRF